MNLFMRFMIVLFAALFGKPATAPLEPTRVGIRIWLTDHAFGQAIPHSRLRSFTDLATINSVIRIGLGQLIRKNGWMPIIQSESIQQTGSLQFPQKLDIRTSIVGWHQNYVCYFHEIFAGGNCVATSHMLARIVGRRGSAVAISGIATQLGAQDQSPSINPQFQAMIAESEQGRAASAMLKTPVGSDQDMPSE